MQNDGPEKTAEIMQMDDVFFNSKLNISAAEADVSRGLVFDRKPLLTKTCVTTAKTPKGQEDMSVCISSGARSIYAGKPLNKRGWVFQERILSPRILHFTKDQVLWECRSLEASETLPHGFPRSRPAYLDKRIGMDSTTFHSQGIKSRWYELVEAYSYTSLSFADDHLLAISAVAKRFCSSMRVDPSNYLAGMWKDDLPLSMIWHQESIPGRRGPSETEHDLEMKYAPSWSWASIMAPIGTVDFSSLVATTSVINIDVQRRSRNVFDGTVLCRLCLRGPLCKFRRQLQGGIPWIQIAEDTTFQEDDHINYSIGRFIMIFWDTARRFTAEEYFFLHVVTEVSEDGPMERGVVLVRTAEHGTHKRVGGFFIPFTSEYSGSKFEDAFIGRFDTLSSEDYLEVDTDGKYVINVI